MRLLAVSQVNFLVEEHDLAIHSLLSVKLAKLFTIFMTVFVK